MLQNRLLLSMKMLKMELLVDGRIREGSQGDIINVMDTVSGSRVIQLLGGGSYILGALGGDDAWG